MYVEVRLPVLFGKSQRNMLIKFWSTLRLGPVAATGSHMESNVTNIDSDSKDRNERVYRVVFGTWKSAYEEK